MEKIEIIWNYIQLHLRLVAAEHFINAALALLLSLIIGFIIGPRGTSAIPLFWKLTNLTFGSLSLRLDNLKREGADLLLRGFFISVLIIILFGAFGVWLTENIKDIPDNRLLEIILITSCLSTGSLIHHGMRLYQVLKGAKISDGTYLILARTSRINFANRDDYTLIRTASEILVRLLDKACVAPLIWYAIAGLPGLFIYSGLAAFSWQHGYDGTYDNIGKIALGLERLMGFIPSLFTAMLIAAGTFIVPKTTPLAGFKFLTRPHDSMPYEQGGMPMSIITNLLGITLGGSATHINGRSLRRVWTGPKNATAKLTPEHMKKVLYMVFIAYMIMITVLLSASLWASLLI